jgi:hypothetical protein
MSAGSRSGRVLSGFAAGAALVVLLGCQPTTNQVSKGTPAGVKYSGPAYVVAVETFQNKTPLRILGMGDAATRGLAAQLRTAGLGTISMIQETLPTETLASKPESMGQAELPDFRIQGAVISYSTVEEGASFGLGDRKLQTAIVKLNYSLIEAVSEQPLLTESATGEFQKQSIQVASMSGQSSAEMELRDGALRDALSKAVEKIVLKITEQPFTGRILAISGQTAVIRAGEKSKLAPGARFSVVRSEADPNGKEIGGLAVKREKQIGELTLLNHQNDRISEAKISSGTGFQAGDIIRAVR